MAINPDDDRDAATPVTLQDIVFSCEICHATISEVYASPESNRGIHGGSREEQGIVTKLWITDCAHVTCTKHLDGGGWFQARTVTDSSLLYTLTCFDSWLTGVPLHPQGVIPTASCPVCVMKHDDHSAKELYWIQSLEDGRSDPAIPRAFIDCPPKIMNRDYDGMDAVRFQYARLGGYAIALSATLRDVRRKASALDSVYIHERKYNKQLEQDVLDLNARIDTLLKAEQKLKKWEARREVINHYMSVVSDMSKDMAQMRDELSNLGCEWPIRGYSFEAKHSGSTAQNSTLQGRDVVDSQSSSSRKRKHSPSGADHESEQGQAARIQRRTSKDLMPPPNHPASESLYESTFPHLLPSTRSTLPARSRPQKPQISHQPPFTKHNRNMANFPIKRTELEHASVKPHQVSSSYTLGRTADAASNESARILAMPPLEPNRVADSRAQWLPSNLRSSGVLDQNVIDSSRTGPIGPWRQEGIKIGDGSSYDLFQSRPRLMSRHWQQARDVDPRMPNLNRPADPAYSSPFFARATLAHPAQQPRPPSYYGPNEASQWQQPTTANVPSMHGYSREMQSSEQSSAAFADYSGRRSVRPRHDMSDSGPLSGVQRPWYTSDPASDHLANDQALYSSYGTNHPDQQSIRDRPRGRISLPPTKTHAIRRSDSVLLSRLPGVRGIHSSQRAAAVTPVPARDFRPPQAANNNTYHHVNYPYTTAGGDVFPSAAGRRSARR